jgi:thioredoxin reductase
LKNSNNSSKSKKRMYSAILLLLSSIIIPSLTLSTTTTTNKNDICIIGAGPGGIQLSIFLTSVHIQHIVLEKASHAGAFFVNLPRQGKLISINKRHTGSFHPDHKLRHDWNSLLNTSMIQHSPMTMWSDDMFPTAHRYVEYLKSVASKLSTIQYNHHVMKIDKDLKQNIFLLTVLHTPKSLTISCNKVVLANGITKPIELSKLKGFSTLVTQYVNSSPLGKDYNGKRVLILGSGNSGHEMAQAMSGWASHVHIVSRSPLRLGGFTHYVGDLRAVNLEFLDTYQLKSLDVKIEMDEIEEKFQFINCTEVYEAGLDEPPTVYYGKGPLVCILPKFLQVDTSPHNETEQLIWQQWLSDVRDHSPFRTPFEIVISALGFEYDTSLFGPNAKPIMRHGLGRKRYLAITCAYESVNVENLFVTGTLSHSRDFKRASGGFVHGFRYQALALTRIFLRGLSRGGRGIPDMVISSPSDNNNNQCPTFNTLLSHSSFPIPPTKKKSTTEDITTTTTTTTNWPLDGERSLSFDITEITDAIISRIRSSSGLYQLFGELVDVIILDNPIQNKVRMLYEVPRCACAGPMDKEQLYNWRNNTFASLLEDGLSSSSSSCGTNNIKEYWNGEQRSFALCDDRFSRLLLSFRYREGFKGPDVIGPDRVGSTHPRFANESNFLHPVVEFIPSTSAMAVSPPDSFHFVEDIQAQWSTDFYDIDPFRSWLRRVVGRGGNPHVKSQHFVFTGEGEFESMRTHQLKMNKLIPGIRVRLIRPKYKSLLKGRKGTYLGPSSADVAFCEVETFACLSKQKSIQKIAVRWDPINNQPPIGLIEVVWIDYIDVIESTEMNCEDEVNRLTEEAYKIEMDIKSSPQKLVTLVHDLVQVMSDVMTEPEDCNYLQPSCYRQVLAKANESVKVVNWISCKKDESSMIMSSLRWMCGVFVSSPGGIGEKKNLAPVYVPFFQVKL